ncbi:MAG: Hcp family type VI secretion system effector [Thermoleophilia bacterium]
MHTTRLCVGEPRILRSALLVALILLAAGAMAITSAGAQPQDTDVVGDLGLRGFIKFDGIVGESSDAAHKDWSDLSTFDQALLAPSGPGGTGRRIGQVAFEDLIVAKALDKAGPKLQEAAAKGKVIPRVQIELTRPAGDSAGAVFYSYELKNVLVTSYNIGTTGQAEVTPNGLPRVELGGPTVDSSWPVEEVSLAFEEIKVTYTEYGDQGQKMGNVEFTWRIE